MQNDVLTNVLAFATVLSAFVLAFVQLVKTALNIPKNIVPLVGLGIGLIVGAAAFPFTDMNIVLRLWAGALAGLSATGLFELGFNKRNGNTRDDKSA